MVEPHADSDDMSQHLWVSCPKCQRANLRIRRAHLGRRVLCKHCGQSFRARTAHDPSAAASSTQPILPDLHFPTRTRADEKGVVVLDDKPQQTRGLHDELAAARSENARLRAAVAQLGSQVADGARREHELWSELHEIRIQLQETKAPLALSDSESTDARAQEFENLRTERDRLAADQLDRQDQLDAAREQFEKELQSLRTEAERLRYQLETLGRERDAARGQLELLGRERDDVLGQLAVLVKERDRLAVLRADDSQRHGKCLEALKNELELAHAVAAARHDDVAAAESARADFERRLAEAENQLCSAIETSNRLDAQARASRAQLAELERATDQRQAFAGDLESARLRIEELAFDLDQARRANEQLRALLNVFGLVDHLESRPRPAALREASISSH